jgi:ketosteroid isomerase-like protein
MVGAALVALGLLVLSAPSVAEAQGPRMAIEAANARFSADFAKGDATALASYYTATGEAFPPNGEIVRGREAIAKLWKGAMDAGMKAIKLTTLEVDTHGELAYEVGTYVAMGNDGKTLDSGKYVVVWKREGGGWKLHRDIWNTSSPAPK